MRYGMSTLLAIQGPSELEPKLIAHMWQLTRTKVVL